MKQITKDIYYIGVNDHQLDLFEGQYIVPNGMAYNSYLIDSDGVVGIFNTVDINFFDEWLEKIKDIIKDREVNYLIVQHMEPDHSANIMRFLKEYPNAILVTNELSYKMIEQFFGKDISFKDKIFVNDGSLFSIGEHELKIINAPMVHWPEVFFLYDSKDKILFSADAFGKFGALDVEEDWACEARRYYFGIVGKFGLQVQNVLKKVSAYEIEKICPLHGPILTENLAYYINLYDIWSSYKAEKEGVFIAYTSVYGHTKKAAYHLKEELEKAGCPKVAISDLAREDMAECLEDAFKYGKLVLATTTYNMEIFPFMSDFITRLIEHGFQNRIVGIIENGTWAPQVERIIKAKLSGCKNITFANTTVNIVSNLNTNNHEQIKKLADELK